MSAAAGIGAGVSGIGSVVGGYLNYEAATKAAKEQAQTAANSLNWIKSVYGQTGNNLQPYIGTGQAALNQLAGFYGLPGANSGGASAAYGQFTNTPFYQFPLQQANLATNRQLAASGLTNSGAALRDVSQLNAGYASQGLGQYLSGLTGLSSGGLGAAGTLGQIGTGTFSGVGAANAGIGNAQAAGTIGSTNAITGALGSLLGTAGNSQNSSSIANFLNSLGGSSYSQAAIGQAPGPGQIQNSVPSL